MKQGLRISRMSDGSGAGVRNLLVTWVAYTMSGRVEKKS